MIAYILIIFGFAMRLLPHVPNMAPVAAIAVFAGAYLDKRIVPWVPLAIILYVGSVYLYRFYGDVA